MRIYTKSGDDGTTGLLFGGRVAKDSALPAAYGSVDEAQAALGVARAHAEPGGELDGLLLDLERDLYVLMAEVATAPGNRSKLTAGETQVSEAMVRRVEQRIDEISDLVEMPRAFVLPGGSVIAAHLDVARTVVRRAERAVVGVAEEGSLAGVYLNRLSDLCWVLARWQEQSPTHSRPRAE